ncbi:phosphopantetheine-binding protein [Photorhabdus asymbiotica]|uniref:phosphopantetheine-binding protein n=1 Tax=Photorhabdus asymbiotica TaxID=291112 RepID=UPI003DA733AF
MITVEEVCAQISMIVPDVTVNPDDKLDESGIDSMTLVRLVLQLENEFDIMIPDALLGPETFKTPRSITNALNMSEE